MNRVREIRRARGLTQDELSKRANISRPFLSDVERGKAVPTVTVAGDIAAALDSTMDDLFSRALETSAK